MDIIISYDVNTLTKEGRSRLRRVAKACKNFGQRVQFSVFECTVTDTQMEQLRQKVLSIMDEKEDNLRIYYLRGQRKDYLEAHGRDMYIDFSDPLVI